MGRTINGKDVGDILKGLSMPFDKGLFKSNIYGHPYLPVEVYRGRLDEVVGIMNYDVATSTPEVVLVGTRPQVLLKASISIRDDDGNVVVSKESPGGCPVIVDSANGEAVSVKNDAETAAHDAFKRCCKLLGIGDKQLKQLRDEKRKVGDSHKDTGQAKAAPAELFRITVKGQFEKLGRDGYAAMVAVEGGEDSKLVIWKDAQERIQEKIPMDKFLRLYVPGKSFSVYARRNTFAGNNAKPQRQLVMVAPYCGDGG